MEENEYDNNQTSEDFDPGAEDSGGTMMPRKFTIGDIQADIAGYEEIDEEDVIVEDEDGDPELTTGKKGDNDEWLDEMQSYDPDGWAYAEDDVDIPVSV